MKANGQSLHTPEQIHSELNSRLHSAANRISADVEPEGRIILRGTVASYYQKQLAQEAILHHPGVAQVVNQIVVDPYATEAN